jgi:hypothetical protein
MFYLKICLTEIEGKILLWDVDIRSDNHVRFRGRPAKTVPSRVRLLYTGRCVLLSALLAGWLVAETGALKWAVSFFFSLSQAAGWTPGGALCVAASWLA